MMANEQANSMIDQLIADLWAEHCEAIALSGLTEWYTCADEVA